MRLKRDRIEMEERERMEREEEERKAKETEAKGKRYVHVLPLFFERGVLI